MFHSVFSPTFFSHRGQAGELELSQLAPSPTLTAMTPSCGASAVPYTLLGALLTDGSYAPSWPACGGRAFLRDYAQRGTNAMLWAALLTVTWVLILRVAALLRLWALGSRLPGPPALLVDPGLAAVCRAGGDITGYLSKLHGSFGPVVRLWLGPSQLLVSIKDVSLIKEILAKADDKLPLTERTYNLSCGRLGLFISSFEKVKSSRESLEVFLNEKLNVGASESPFKIIEAVLNRVDSTMDKDSLDCRYFSQHMAFNIIGAALFGEVFFDWSDAAAYKELLMIVAKDGCFWASYAVPPFWKPAYRKYRSLCAKLKILTEGIIRTSMDQRSLLSHNDPRSCKKSEGVVKDPVGCTSLLDGIIPGRWAAEEPLGSKEEICGNIMGLLLHGISASANLVGSILTRLVLYPKLKDQLYADIVAVSNQSSGLEVDDVLRMQFLLATVCESARLLPAGPLLQRCSLQHDLTLKSSIIIPAGATLVVPLHLVQMDVSTWGHDACQFNPSRLLQKGIDLGEILAAHKGSNRINLFTDCDKTDSFLPFGSESRACVGQKFAILGISMLIASLLLNYEVHRQPALSKEMDLAVDSNNLRHLPNPKLILTKRSEARVQ